MSAAGLEVRRGLGAPRRHAAGRRTLDLEDIQTQFDLIYVHNRANTAWFRRPVNDRNDVSVFIKYQILFSWYGGRKGMWT